MSNPDSAQHPSNVSLERRVRARQKLRSVAYIDLGPSNGGLVLNLSEAGLAFSSAKRLVGEHLPALSFKLPGSAELIETRARVVWMSESKREAGVRFEQLAEEDARKINAWVAEEQGLFARLHIAVEPPERLASIPLPKQRLTDPVAPRQVTKQQARPEQPIFAASTGIATTSSPDEHQPAQLADPARKRRLAMAISLFAVTVLLAFVAGVKDRRRAMPPSKPEQVVANSLINDTEKTNSTPDAAVTRESPVAEIKNQPDGVDGSIQPISSSKTIPPGLTSEVGVSNPINKESQQQANGSASKSSEPDSSQVLLRKAGPPQTSRDSSTKGPTEKSAPLGKRPLTIADAKRLQEEAAADRALELASETKPPRETPDATNEPAKANDGDGLAAASSNAILPTGSVEVRLPSSPSMRITADLEGEVSGDGRNAQLGRLISRVQPEYPAEALRQELQGLVKAHIAISSEGEVESVDAAGPPLLVEAVTIALRQWRYTPTLLNLKAIPADENVIIIFRLSGTTPK